MMKNRRKKTILRISFIILFIIIVLIIYFSANKLEKAFFTAEIEELSSKYDRNRENLVEYQGNWYERKDNIDTVLILGIDHFGISTADEESQQADFLLLLIIDHDEVEFTGVMINRDTMTDIQTFGEFDNYLGKNKEQIALSHTYGSNERERCKNTRWAVENLFYGITIDNYLSLTMDAVPILNDFVGGVPVKIQDDFQSIDPSLIMGDTITLRKDQALTYVRSRKGMAEETNINRMDRQKEYLESFINCARKNARKDSNFYSRMLNEAADYIVMDCSSGEVLKLERALGEYRYENIISLAGESKSGTDYMEYYVDEEELERTMIDLFYNEIQLEEKKYASGK